MLPALEQCYSALPEDCEGVLGQIGVKAIEQSLYTPDMAPADLFLISKLKKELAVA